jgi:hypothetical protein
VGIADKMASDLGWPNADLMNSSSARFCFVVTTWKRDLRYAKPLLESIHYWHPDVPVKVIVDGEVNANVLWKVPNVVSIDFTANLQKLHRLDLRGLLSDLNLFFFDDYDYYIRVDADSVLIGEVLEGIRAQLPFDFLSLDGRDLDLKRTEHERMFCQYCFSPAEMRNLGEDFPDHALYFSGGHFCARKHLFSRDYMAKWRPHMSPEFRKDLLFKFNDQSFLNYAVNAFGARGELKAKLWHVTINGKRTTLDHPECSEEKVRNRESGRFRLIHYTGPSRRWRFDDHNFGWSLSFFNELWYSRIGWWGRCREILTNSWDHYAQRKTWSKIYHGYKDRRQKAGGLAQPGT